MAYTKQTWTNGPGGGTPLSAARLGHLEDGLADAHAQLAGVPATYAKQDVVGFGTKRGVYLTGCNGTTSTFANAGGVGSLRLVMRLPVSPTRFRVKIRNYDTVTGTAKSAVTGKGISIGTHLQANDGFETGNLVGGTLSPLVSGNFTIPGDGSWYTSAWFTPVNYAITENVQFILAYGYDAGAAITFPRGVGQAWHATDLSLLTGTTSAPGTPMANTPMEVQLEYEFADTRRVVLFIGDSITEGLGGQSALGNLPFLSWPALWAARNHAVSVNIGVSGAQSGNWAGGGTGRYWTRADLSVIQPDAVVVSLGSNDANNSTSLATFQTNMIDIASSVRSLFGADTPLFLGNVTPRTLEATVKEPLRLSFNNWLEGLPLRALACFDFDAVVRDPADNTRIFGAPTNNTAYNYDGTHFTRRGYNKMSQAVGRLVP